MKILVDELPCSKYECPFSKAYSMPPWDERMNHREWFDLYDCDITKGLCDLNCGACSGLKVLKTED